MVCSPEAQRLGIQAGMSVAEATGLTNRHGRHALHVEPYDPSTDLEALEKLAVWCHRFSPLVGIDEVQPPETLLLDVGGVTSLFGGEESLIRQTRRGLRQLRLNVQMGLASTLGAAWALAHYGCGEADREYLAIAAPGQSQASIHRLPLAALRLPARMLETLQRLGLVTIADLLPLPRAELKARFGGFLLKRLDQILDQAPEMIVSVRSAPDFEVEWCFECPTGHHNSIQLVIEKLVERLCVLLSRHQRGVLVMICDFHYQHVPSTHLEVGLFRPSIDPRHLLQLVHVQLNNFRLSDFVTGISLRATSSAPLVCRQEELVTIRGRDYQDSPRIASLVERLSGRVGRLNVVRYVLQNDAQPEMAYRAEPLIGCRSRRKTCSPVSFTPLHQPIHLLPEPLRLQVVMADTGGPPSHFQYHGHQQQVARHWGPERIETGWWRQRNVRRDYYRVETTTGQRLWIFRCRKYGSWFLHGMFG